MTNFDSMVMYKTWLDVARSQLPEEDACKLMVQIMEYGFTGKVPEFDNVVMQVIFDMARPNIDSNIKKKINGKKGGRKPGGQPGNKNAKKPGGTPKDENEKKRITTGLSNANANANGNVNANGNANVNANVSSFRSASDERANEDEMSVEEWEAMIDAL